MSILHLLQPSQSSLSKPYMADKRQFRFRLPWQKRGSQVEPEPRPAAKTQTTTQTTATVPVDRSPFRPVGIAPVKASPSQGHSPSRTKPPPPSPSRATDSKKTSGATSQTQLQVKAFPSQAHSPSRTEPPPPSPSPSRATDSQKTSGATSQTQTQVESSPPSPSHVASQPQAASPVSPQIQSQPTTPQESSEIPSFSAQPPSPASQPEPKEAISQPPLREPQPNAEIITSERSQIPSLSPEPPSPASQPGPKEAISQPPLREPQPNAEIITSETISNAQNNTPKESAIEASAEAVETIASPEKVDHKHLPESETESKEHKEEEKVVQVLNKEEKTNDAVDREPMKETVTQVHAAETGSGKHPKHLPGVAFQAEQRHKKQGTFERKETSATSSSSGKPIKTRKDRSTSRIPFRKMVSSTAEQALPHKEIKEDVLKLDKLTTDLQTHENPVSVITLAGENRGGSVHLSSDLAEEESIHIHRSYKINPDDSPEATTDEEVSNEGEILEDQMSTEDQQMRACINSNVQSINNSILFNSYVTEGSPGVHADFSHHPAESSKSNGKSEPLETHKAEITKTPSEKRTHEPTVRRRCLGGLLMEQSDSEPDNPEKPRRHGCRYNCGMKKKDSESGIL